MGDNEQVKEYIARIDGILANAMGALTKEQALLEQSAALVEQLDEVLYASTEVAKTITQGCNQLALMEHTPLSGINGFDIASLAVTMFEFTRIPILYLSGLPVNRNDNARWILAAFFLTLSAIAVMSPPSALAITLVIACAGVGISLIVLGDVLLTRYRLGQEALSIDADIETALLNIELFKQEAEALKQQLQQAQSIDNQILNKIPTQIKTLEEELKEQLDLLVELKLQRADVQERIEKLGVKTVVFKSMDVILSCLSFIGLIVSIFFPPVGAAILLGTAVLGLTYVSVKYGPPLLHTLGSWLLSQMNSIPETQPSTADTRPVYNPIHNQGIVPVASGNLDPVGAIVNSSEPQPSDLSSIQQSKHLDDLLKPVSSPGRLSLFSNEDHEERPAGSEILNKEITPPDKSMPDDEQNPTSTGPQFFKISTKPSTPDTSRSASPPRIEN